MCRMLFQIGITLLQVFQTFGMGGSFQPPCTSSLSPKKCYH